MSSAFEIAHLDPCSIAQAFPLVQAMRRELSLDQWTRFAEAMTAGAEAGEHGIVAAWGGGGYIHGLFSYAVMPELHYGRTLHVDNFVALDLRRERVVAQELVASVRDLARGRRCDGVYLIMPEGFQDLLDEAGFIPVIDRPREARTGLPLRGRRLMVAPVAG